MLVGSGVWNDEDELAEAYVARKGFAYGVSGRPERHARCWTTCLASVEVIAYQNLDSVELGVTTVDHYFDTLGRHHPRGAPGARRDVRHRLYRRPDPRRRHRPHLSPNR